VDGETIICPWHGYDFHVRTGECSVAPELRVATFPVKIEANAVLVEVD
jgi:3-phenylpropionate/trans-cinnamate dioxygenase ferredoxin subunit